MSELFAAAHNTLEDKAFQLALELLNNDTILHNSTPASPMDHHQASLMPGSLMMSQETGTGSESLLHSPISSNGGNYPMLLNGLVGEDRVKKSQNMTECVPVPSSEHVAEIVGRQGCKIKALRAKTNTYIKTPVRGEEPVFVVTGRKEDVAKAKREILSAADHFSLIRASRKPAIPGSITYDSKKLPGPPTNIPGQITIQVRVPYRVVGLVVGPKGATIKHIQQQTQTYIVTPSRDKEPVFEVTGLPENVNTARCQIEAHIALRTGATSASGQMMPDENSDVSSPELLASLYNSGIESIFNYLDTNKPLAHDMYKNAKPSSIDSSGCSSTSSVSSSASTKSLKVRQEIMEIWKNVENEDNAAWSKNIDPMAADKMPDCLSNHLNMKFQMLDLENI